MGSVSGVAAFAIALVSEVMMDSSVSDQYRNFPATELPSILRPFALLPPIFPLFSFPIHYPSVPFLYQDRTEGYFARDASQKSKFASIHVVFGRYVIDILYHFSIGVDVFALA